MIRRGTSLFGIGALLAALTAGMSGRAAGTLSADRGAAGTWQKLLKLRTTASAMHTTAHPDDEHGGVLAWISRGLGARLSLLTLNRGESGDNAIGAELFDGLGLIRTEELLLADRYYGVDEQYFTSVVDYGFSKRLDEAWEKWGQQNVLGEVVRVVRIDRPLVLIARFQGNARDGHGNHQAAGLVTQEAFRAAGDPAMFPEQIAEGLRPWPPLKLYVGGVRENEDWTLRTDAGEYSPWLGESYNDFARIGLGFQRSQNGGQVALAPGPSYGYYKRLASTVPAPDKEASFFDGIDTRLSSIFAMLGRPAPAGAADVLRRIEGEVSAATAAFTMADPSTCVPALTRGLAATREALALAAADPDAVFLLRIKERQFMDAINSALGVELSAVAQPAGTREPTGPYAAYAPPVTFAAPVPGQRFEVVARLANRGGVEIAPSDLAIEAGRGWTTASSPGALPAALGRNAVATRRFDVALAEDTPLGSRPYYSRASILEDRYQTSDPAQRHRPAATAAAEAIARYTVAGVAVEAREAVRRREAQLPYGYALREVMVVPAVAVNLAPSTAVIPAGSGRHPLALQVELIGNADRPIEGQVALELPAGWVASPASHSFRFSRAGERSVHAFEVAVPSLSGRSYEVIAVATAGGRQYRDGYQLLEHRDLETRYLYRAARSEVKGVDVKIAPGLTVGYVMGVGDQVPAGIAQLGARVQLLDERDLASGDLARFDAIVTGTRAYVVREDLRTYNQRLLDYVKGGGNLIVLYNTPEFVPAKLAPYPADLPPDAEEVSEEDSPVEILAPDEPVLHQPNEITLADFQGWVEQRGSKFFASWDAAYTALIATHDKGQDPQKGGWLTARYGKGHYTYFAYALHRQLPYGVPGAYRLLANLLSLGRPALATARPAAIGPSARRRLGAPGQ
ncbi:MAG TPA: PIG-L family deacetylase [Vicinamibacteria bacterium]|nr:PIG-L family deacetylase [Vicinamibacteria bacterium]